MQKSLEGAVVLGRECGAGEIARTRIIAWERGKGKGAKVTT